MCTWKVAKATAKGGPSAVDVLHITPIVTLTRLVGLIEIDMLGAYSSSFHAIPLDQLCQVATNGKVKAARRKHVLPRPRHRHAGLCDMITAAMPLLHNSIAT